MSVGASIMPTGGGKLRFRTLLESLSYNEPILYEDKACNGTKLRTTLLQGVICLQRESFKAAWVGGELHFLKRRLVASCWS